MLPAAQPIADVAARGPAVHVASFGSSAHLLMAMPLQGAIGRGCSAPTKIDDGKKGELANRRVGIIRTHCSFRMSARSRSSKARVERPRWHTDSASVPLTIAPPLSDR